MANGSVNDVKITINGTADNSDMLVFAGGQEGSPVNGNAHIAVNGGHLKGLFFHGVRLNDKTIQGDATIEIGGGTIDQLGAVYNLNTQPSTNKATVDGKASIIIKGTEATIKNYDSYYYKESDIFPYSLIFKDYGTDSRPASLPWDIEAASEVIADNSYILPGDKSFIFAKEHGLALAGKTWVLPTGSKFTIKSYGDATVDFHQEVVKSDDWDADDFAYQNEEQPNGSLYKVGNSIRYGSGQETFHTVTIQEPAEEDKEKGTLSVVWDGTVVKSGDRVPQVENKMLKATLMPALGYNGALYMNDQLQEGLSVETSCDQDLTFRAGYSEKEYAVTISPLQNGSIKVTNAEGAEIASGSKAAYQSSNTVTVIPSLGYQLLAESLKATYVEDGADPEEPKELALTDVDGNPGTYTFYMPAGNVTITATFEEKSYAICYTQPENGLIKVTNAEGAEIASDSKAAYQSSNTVTVTPSLGYQLLAGSLKATYVEDGAETEEPKELALTDVDGKPGTYTFNMPAGNVTITATFEEKSYAIYYTQPENGLIKVTNAEGAEITSGSKAAYQSSNTVTVTPSLGYQLLAGSLKATYVEDGADPEEPKELALTDVDGKPGTYAFNMPAGDVTIVAQMDVVDYKITINQPQGGTISADKETGHLGDIVKLSYQRDTYFYFEHWIVQTVSGKEIKVSEENTFEMPAEGVVVTALFSYNPPYEPSYYALSFEENDSVSFTADRTLVKEGGSFTFTADVAAGYDPSTLVVEYRTGYYSSWKIATPKGDGSYQIRAVYNNIYVRARVDRWKDPTDIESLSDSKTTIRISGRNAYITVANSAVMHIVNLAGQVVRVVKLSAGNNEVTELPQGYHLLVIEKDVCKKVLIK